MPYEPGRYHGRIKDHGIFKPQAGQQHPTVRIDVDLTGRYDPATGERGPCAPGTRTYSRAITPKTINWVRAELRAIGYDRHELRYFDPQMPGAENLIGREIDVVCKYETYKGGMSERWSIYLEPARKEKLTQIDLEALDARFGEESEKASGDGPPDADPPTVRDPGYETP
jgi:hypothetical protein